MNERQKEILYAGLGILLCACVFANSAYQTYLYRVEYTVEFRVFEVNCWDKLNKRETQVLTWGVGKYYFIGNWTGQFIEGSTYNVTYVKQTGSNLRGYKDLIVLRWEEV